MSTFDEGAELALQAHAVKLGHFALGKEPPTLVENEAEAKLVFAGIAHMMGVRDAQRELIAEYKAWEAGAKKLEAICNQLSGAFSPALESWRKAMLSGNGNPPRDRAAAWELTAVMCELAGNVQLAEDARRTAKHIVAAAARHRVTTPAHGAEWQATH